MENLLTKFMVALKEDIQSSLASLGNYPKKDPFDHGQAVGTYQGLQKALDTLNAVLKDQGDDNST